ncbi:hypothetical protein QBC45DRAFT_437708 [Copromyces sp. CBS 386.78]|nr:hypothetical protein QBC45DRAFT_437708 [Copromyces sp. CBS 386.78]
MVTFKSALLTLSVVGSKLVSAIAIPGNGTTPHDQYSSSVGVLGCKIDINRVAYWPSSVDCDQICVEVTANGRSVTLLKIDQSGGAYDISFDAWNYLKTGYPAVKDHISPGGGFAADYNFVPAENCRHLIKTASGKLPFTAANSMNFISSCTAGRNSWVGNNHELWNVLDSVCNHGFNELCTLAPGANQATCEHPLGSNDVLTGQDVLNILYPSGEVRDA